MSSRVWRVVSAFTLLASRVSKVQPAECAVWRARCVSVASRSEATIGLSGARRRVGAQAQRAAHMFGVELEREVESSELRTES